MGRARAHGISRRATILLLLVVLAAAVGIWWWRHRQPARAPERALPRIAIVLDDWGYNTQNVPMLTQLHRPVTLAVLPRLRYSSTVARAGRAAGCEIILHLPIESHRLARDPRTPAEARTIRTTMSEAEIVADLREALASVPGCRGVSNHQGSKGTEDARLMRAILRELQARHLYFLDSLVTPRTVCRQVARDVGVPFAQRRRFLDNDNREPYIETQLRQLVSDAKAEGRAVGIGHDRPVTLAVLARLLPQLERQGVRFVWLSELVQ